MTTQTITRQKVRVETELEEPKKWNVIFQNDSETSFEFVIGVLITHFDYTAEAAHSKTREIHEEDGAIVATYTFEIAEQKAIEVVELARSKGYPLVVQVVKDD